MSQKRDIALALAGLAALIGAGLLYARSRRLANAGPDESYGLILVIDGARGDAWKQYAQEGKLPTIKRLFLDEGVWADNATTVFPTITGAGMPAVLTGNVPGRHGMPSLYFFDRETRTYPVLFTFREALEWNQWLSPDVKTVWEHFEGEDDALAIGPALSRGADQSVSVAWNVEYKPLEYRTKLAIGLRQIGRDVLGTPPARLTVVYAGWFDHMEHGLGATHPDMDPQYAAVDAAINSAVETFEATIDRREAAIGRPVSRYIALVSDHGHQDIEQTISVDAFVREAKQARVVDKVWTRVFGVAVDSRTPQDFDDREIVLAAGEGHALLYFPTPKVDPSGSVLALDWDTRPSLELLHEYPYRDGVIDVIAETVQWDQAVSFAVAKDRDSGRVHVFSKTGEATIERDGSHPTRSGFRYTIVSGTDPLRYADSPTLAPLLDGDFHPGDDWQRATALTDAPDGPVMLYQAFDYEDRAPDLYVSAAPHVSIGDLVDGEKSASKHGGLTKEEAWSTVAFHGTGISNKTLFTARNIDVVPTMLSLLDVDFDPDEKDGKVLDVR